jgi:uncharacterized membrane protein
MEVQILIILIALVYFMPTLAAIAREHKRGWGVLILNVLLGWTILGWMLLLAYALLSEAEEY